MSRPAVRPFLGIVNLNFEPTRDCGACGNTGVWDASCPACGAEVHALRLSEFLPRIRHWLDAPRGMGGAGKSE